MALAERFTAVLEAALRSRSWTAAELARVSGLTQATAWRIVRGKQSASLEQLEAILRAFGWAFRDFADAIDGTGMGR